MDLTNEESQGDRFTAFVRRWRFTAFVIVATLVVIILGVRTENTATEAKRQAEVNKKQTEQLDIANQALEQFVLDLQAEAKTRTLESCLNQAAARENNRQTLLGVIDELTPKNPDGTPVQLSPAQQARIEALRRRVIQETPVLTCPDNSTIVIPTPSTTTPEG